MQGYNFTERVRKVLALTREAAAQFHHEYVGTEHILLGLMREGDGVAAAVLRNLHVEFDDIERRTEKHKLLGTSTSQGGGRLRSRDDVRRCRPIRFTIRVECEGGRWYEERLQRLDYVIAFLQNL